MDCRASLCRTDRLVLSRQNLPDLAGCAISYDQGWVKELISSSKNRGKPDFTLMATGSELSLAMDVAAALEKIGKAVRVISMPAGKFLKKQSEEYKNSVVGGDLGQARQHRGSSQLWLDKVDWYRGDFD